MKKISNILPKVILTGFGPFGPYKLNPTESLVDFFHENIINGEREIIGAVLPSEYYGSFGELSSMIDEIKPYAVISMGLSSSINSIRIETVFQNKMEGKYHDATGFMPRGEKINKELHAQKFLRSTANNVELAKILEKNGVLAKVSKDAGTYFCNSLGYLTTEKILKYHPTVKNMFIHIPWTDDYMHKVRLEKGKIFVSKHSMQTAIELLATHI